MASSVSSKGAITIHKSIVIRVERNSCVFNNGRFECSSKYRPYLLDNLNISSNSAPPVDHHEFTCRCLETNKILLPLELTAATRGDRSYQVFLKGSNIFGPSFVEGASSYAFEYRPISIGKKKIR